MENFYETLIAKIINLKNELENFNETLIEKKWTRKLWWNCNSKRNQLKSFYKPLVLLKIKLFKIYATKIIKVFFVQKNKRKKNFHKISILL